MKILIPQYFQPFTGWHSEVEVTGASVGQVLNDLFRQHPDLYPHFYTHWGVLSANVLIYLNQDEIFTLQGMDTPIKPGDSLRVVPTVSGG
jgi:molybdopterin converting factor small subunit